MEEMYEIESTFYQYRIEHTICVTYDDSGNWRYERTIPVDIFLKRKNKLRKIKIISPIVYREINERLNELFYADKLAEEEDRRASV